MSELSLIELQILEKTAKQTIPCMNTTFFFSLGHYFSQSHECFELCVLLRRGVLRLCTMHIERS